MNSRNILNTWELDRFLSDIYVPNNDDKVRRWLDRVARRWILREFCAAGRVVRVRDDCSETNKWLDIEWEPGADRRGVTVVHCRVPSWYDETQHEGVHWLDLEGKSADLLAEQLAAVAWYFANLKNPPSVERLARVPPQDMIATAQQFRESIRDWAMELGDCVLRYSDGSRMVRLTTPEDLEREGRLMRNCVASYAAHLGGHIEILSLHDEKHRPHVNIEIRQRRWVSQVLGKANGPVADRYRPHVAALVAEMGLDVTRNHENTEVPDRPLDRFYPRFNLAWSVHSDLAGRPTIGPWEAFRDPTRATRTMPESAWSWTLDLFRGPQGRLVWMQRARGFEVSNREFAVLVLRYPAQLYGALRAIGGARCRAVCRQIEDEMAALLITFCREDSAAVLDPGSSPIPLRFDLRRLRHEHQERLRRRLAAARRDMRRRAEAYRNPYAALAKWEDDRRVFGRLLHERTEAYF